MKVKTSGWKSGTLHEVDQRVANFDLKLATSALWRTWYSEVSSDFISSAILLLLKWKSSLLKGFALLKTIWLFSEVGTKKPVESESRMFFSRAWWYSSLGLMACGEGGADGWGSGGGVEALGGRDLGRKARGCSEVSVGVGLAETEMYGNGDESGVGVFSSIWIMLKLGEFLVGVGG